MTLKGMMVVLEGREGAPEEIVNVFIPTNNEETAIKMVSGNGEILATFPYIVKSECCKQVDWNNFMDRLVEVNNIEL